MATVHDMTEVGIRELKNNLSRYIAEVKDGAELTVTEHGRPVARLVPIGGERTVEALIREGRATPPLTPDSDWLPEPIKANGSVLELFLEEKQLGW